MRKKAIRGKITSGHTVFTVTNVSNYQTPKLIGRNTFDLNLILNLIFVGVKQKFVAEISNEKSHQVLTDNHNFSNYVMGSQDWFYSIMGSHGRFYFVMGSHHSVNSVIG